MNKYPLYLLVIASTATITASDKDKEAVKTLKGHWGAITANQYKQAAENVNEAVGTAAKSLSPEVLGESGKALTTGLLQGLSKQELVERGEALGAAVVTGMAGAVKSGLIAAPAGAKALAIKAGTAVVAAPATPWIIGGAFVGWVAKMGINVERQKEYGHCLRTHFDSPAVNDEKMPRRCESPERRANWWSEEDAARQRRIYKILKAERRRPRPAVPGLPYWNNSGPNILWEKDLNHKDGK
jgi:hypothetical protein